MAREYAENTMELEEYEYHIRNPFARGEQYTSFCGEPIHGFHFADPTHWIGNIQNEGRLLACLACKEAVLKIIDGERR